MLKKCEHPWFTRSQYCFRYNNIRWLRHTTIIVWT